MHKKKTTKPDLAMIDAPFFLDVALSVYVIVHLLAMQKSNGVKVILRYCNTSLETSIFRELFYQFQSNGFSL